MLMTLNAVTEAYSPFFVSLGLLTMFFLAHVAVWRLIPALRGFYTLVFLALLSLTAGLVFGRSIPIWRELLPATFGENLLLIQLHIFVTLGYTVLYSGIEEQSPSLMILKQVSATGAEGMSGEAIAGLVDDAFLTEQRIEPLLRARMIKHVGDDLILLPRGRVLAGVFHFFRLCTKASKGT
jgi:hypothetical protein